MRSGSIGSEGEPVGNHRLYPEACSVAHAPRILRTVLKIALRKYPSAVRDVILFGQNVAHMAFDAARTGQIVEDSVILITGARPIATLAHDRRIGIAGAHHSIIDRLITNTNFKERFF
jgi:hypothetical protein